MLKLRGVSGEEIGVRLFQGGAKEARGDLHILDTDKPIPQKRTQRGESVHTRQHDDAKKEPGFQSSRRVLHAPGSADKA